MDEKAFLLTFSFLSLLFKKARVKSPHLPAHSYKHTSIHIHTHPTNCCLPFSFIRFNTISPLVIFTCWPSVASSAFLHSWPVGSGLSTWPALSNHLSLRRHWRMAIACKPGIWAHGQRKKNSQEHYHRQMLSFHKKTKFQFGKFTSSWIETYKNPICLHNISYTFFVAAQT